MQSYPGTVTSESLDQSATVRSRIKTGGMLLALAAAVTAGTFLTARHNGWGAHARSAARTGAVVSAARPTSDRAAEPATAPSTPFASRRPSSTTLYLIDSAVNAAMVRTAIDEANTFRLQFGAMPLQDWVWQVPTSAETQPALQILTAQTMFAASAGLPEITLVDLRTVTAAVSAGESAQRAIVDENSLRASLGLPELAMPASEQGARQAIADENQLRASLGLPELTAAN